MSKKIVVKCQNSEETKLVGEKIGQMIQSGQAVELIGDIGSGKTTFVKGLARGLDIKDEITSPTFNLENIYTGRLKLHHLDLYRLNEAGLLTNNVQEVLKQPSTILVAEWGKTIEGILPKDRIKINIQPSGERSRKIKIDLPGSAEFNLA